MPVPVSHDVLSNILARLTRLEEAEENRRLPTTSLQSITIPAEKSQASSSASIYSEHEDSPTSLRRLVTEAIVVARSILRQHGDSSDALVQNQSVLVDLDNVYTEIQKFQHRPRNSPGNGPSSIPKGLIRRWTNTFFDSFGSMPSMVPMTREYTFSIPELMETPHVSIDTSALLVYYNILFQGMLMDEDSIGHRATYSSFIYQQCLQLIEIWEQKPKPIDIDFYAALLMTWLAFEKLDSNLAWEVHCRACRIAQALGYFMLDAQGDEDRRSPDEAMATTQIEHKNRDRYGFWQLQAMDAFFRLHFSKPCVIEPGTWKVNFPNLQSGQQSSGSQQAFDVNFIVAMRLALISLKYFDYTDSHDCEDGPSLDSNNQFIDSLIAELDSIIVEWDIVSGPRSTRRKTKKSQTDDEQEQRFSAAAKPIDAWLYADLLFNSKTTTILLYRAKSQMNKQATVQREALEAARDTIDYVKRMCSLQSVIANYSMSFISVYPIVSVMTLYTNALQTDDMAEAQNDLGLTEWLGATLRAWVKERDELKPVAHVVTALNGVCRQILSLKGSGSTVHGQENLRSKQRQQDAFISHLQDSDVELNSLLQDPLDYMKQLEMDVYRTGPRPA